MVIAVRTERGTTGLEVVKEADSDADRARLRREHALLRQAAHPGVVEVVSAGDSVLRLRHRGTALARLGPLAPDSAAAIVRVIADVVHAIHDHGVVHNRIDTDHVVVDDRGRPRLCGFGGATGAEGFVTIADDVASLGRLLDQLLDDSGDALWSPRYRGLRHAPTRKRALAAFRAAIAQTQRADPSQRISSRQFAAALDDALPDLRLPALDDGEHRDFAQIPTDIDPTADLGWTDDDLWYLSVEDGEPAAAPVGDPYASLASLHTGDDEHPTPSAPTDIPRDTATPAPAEPSEPAGTSGATVVIEGAMPAVHIRPTTPRQTPRKPADERVLLALAVAVLILGVVAGIAAARAIRPFGSGSASASSTALDAVTTTTTVADAPPRTPPPVPPGCEVPAFRGPDADGDGCPDPVSLDGRLATIGTVDIELGQVGDLAVLADHDCDGMATPVLLRPSTGEVFVFPMWSLDAPLEIDVSAVVPGGVAISARDEPCPTVTVRTDQDNVVAVAGPGS